MILNLLLGLILISPVITHASVNSQIRIGCTIGCPDVVVERVEHAASVRGIKVQFIDLSHQARQEELESALANVDAVISPGGMDTDPKYYIDAVSTERREHLWELDSRLGQHDDESRARDEFEFRLRQTYFASDRLRSLPFLGICYGMQMLAVSQGLPLVVDLHEEYGIENRTGGVFDTIRFNPRSLVGSIFGVSTIEALESHHQAVDVREFRRIHPSWVRITGLSNDDLVPEAIEFQSRRSALGVQFHPEGSSVEVSDKIFGWLLAKAVEHKNAVH